MVKISQFTREKDSYVYVENGSKNYSRTSTRIANKVVPVYARPESHPRRLVYLRMTFSIADQQRSPSSLECGTNVQQ